MYKKLAIDFLKDSGYEKSEKGIARTTYSKTDTVFGSSEDATILAHLEEVYLFVE